MEDSTFAGQETLLQKPIPAEGNPFAAFQFVQKSREKEVEKLEVGAWPLYSMREIQTDLLTKWSIL